MNDNIIFSMKKCLFCNDDAVVYSGHIHNKTYGIMTAGFCKKHSAEMYRELKNPYSECEYGGQGCFGVLDKDIPAVAENSGHYFVYFDENGRVEKVEDYD